MKDEQTTKVLKDLNLDDLITRFLQERSTLDIINKLSINEFKKLVLVNRNDIMKLREKCTFYGSYCPQKVVGNGAPKVNSRNQYNKLATRVCLSDLHLKFRQKH